MRVIVSIGGSVLVPTVDEPRVAGYASAIERLREAGHTVGVVVGGGPTAREYIAAARDVGGNEVELDQLGVAVTRLNARLLIAALDETAAPAPIESHEQALSALKRGDVPVMGGTVAGHTTDTVATALAEYADADLLIYATSVPAVFDADPEVEPDATRFESMTPSELLDVIRDIDLSAGSNAPVDLLAVKLLQRSGLHAVVLDGTDPDSVVAAVDGDHDGTEIVSGADNDD